MKTHMKMSERIDTRVIQVTNVAPSCLNEQLRTLFTYLGRVKDMRVYPPENTEGAVARVAYIEFDDSVTTGVALHLSGTVFIDRALMVVPVMDGKIPDETTALQLTPQAVAGMLPGQPTWPANVVSQMTGTGANQVITTYDPRLTSLGLPQYPSLAMTTDASKIEEIRRTVYVSDLDPKISAEMLLSFFSQVGEIKYIRLAGDERAGARAAYIEFTDQRSVAQALTYNNVVFQGRTISVQHSKTSIVKPTGKVNEASQREIDEAMKKVKEASKLISAAAGESKKESSRSPGRKRSRSKSKRRSRSPSRVRRSRSRSKGRHRRSRSRPRRSRSRHRTPRRSRTPIRRRRSRSRGRVVPPAASVARRSRSRDRRRSRTRSPVRRRRSRTRSKTPRRRSRTPPRSYSKSRSRKSRSRSKRRSRSRDRKEKAKEKKKSVSLSPPHLERNGSIPPKDDEEDKGGESPKKLDSSTAAAGEVSRASSKRRSPSPVKPPKRRSPTPRKRSRSRSPGRRKRRRRTRSPSPRKKSRSRSGSRHRSKRDRSKRSHSRDRKRDIKKKTVRDKEEKKKESSSSKVVRDYDEEEKGFASGSDRIREDSEPRSSGSPPPLEAEDVEVEDKDSDHQPVDMDMSD
ncbi:unnamed protein product [Candidula unifasciata]|uniref:RRM domain-containing protein n=1 Tax=Candidula unifasciata TaxID=100452 RepID=A0A8S3Z510_9EUPU|nr:unnamed protein product [Candidula unifasciata]